MSNIKILVATQAEIPFLKGSGDIYVPIIVGASSCVFKNGEYLTDNVGDNISVKNNKYCELTALYWAWKNLTDQEYVGLSHYRRYFLFNYKSLFNLDRLPFSNFSNALLKFISPDKSEIIEIFKTNDIILPSQKKLRLTLREEYYIDKVCHKKDFDIMEQVVLEKYPEYNSSILEIFNGNKIHHFNMFILKRHDFDKYMLWLFDVLFECEKRIDTSNYSPVESRALAFLAERLFTLYVHHNKFNKYELTVGYINPQHRIFKFLKTNNNKIIESVYYLLYILDKYFKIKKK